MTPIRRNHAFSNLALYFTHLAVTAAVASSVWSSDTVADPIPSDSTQTANEPALRSGERRRNVAIVIHEGVELLDFAGPGEVFEASGGGRAFRVYTVGSSTQPVVSQGFLTITPQYAFADCPSPDVLVIPGGGTNALRNDPGFMAWFDKTVPQTEVTLTVCTGAFVLADLGALDGLQATTHWSALPGLREIAPTATLVEDRRFVDNGRIVTAAGVSAGIDGSLHVVERLLGPRVAAKTARYMQYDYWQRQAPHASDSTTSKDDAGTGGAATPHREAEEAWYLGDWPAVISGYERLAQRKPDDVVAVYRMGVGLLFSQRFAEALPALQRAYDLGLNDAAMHYRLGMAHLHLDQGAEARPLLQRAIELGWDGPLEHYNLACALALCGEKDAALDALEMSINKGLWSREMIDSDPQLASLRDDERFASLQARLQTRR